ncbi:RNA polymerase sigma factor [Abyssalbus ytuae]|uniref:RNA polymerase sigma factor n=1 Tax=Abyssalbus ytuae TaxID=2926907 RepID=A0A9E6ZMW4_9FLAO|nr:RNA polymerase sigma-70 factor [Abyssalbus ytuae]UOB17270.1 RNA polymerase sigma-70 factor [Abyssalbus ytuae]
MNRPSGKFDIQELIIKIKNSDHQAFKLMYNIYSPRLIRFLATLNLNDYSDDVIQEVFVTIWKKREELNIDKSFESYLFTITKNKALKILKKEIRFQLDNISDIKDEITFTIENDIFSDELHTSYETLINNLPERPKTIFKMRRLYGWSTEQIAEHLGITPKTVENHMNRALTILKRDIKYISVLIGLYFFK